MRHALFVLMALMLAGYLTVEFAKLKRGRHGADQGLPYPTGRFVVRLLIGALLLTMVGLLAYDGSQAADGSYLPSPLAFPVLGALGLLVIADIGWVAAQARAEASRRQQEFLKDMVRIAADSRKPGD